MMMTLLYLLWLLLFAPNKVSTGANIDGMLMIINLMLSFK
jgi:hypothetical protein